MAKAATQDFATMMKESFGAFQIDQTAFADAFKNTAELNEKLAAVAIEAAEKSTEISAKWTNDTLAKMGDVYKVKAEPSDYVSSMTDFASASAEAAAENVAAFAEVAKKVQMETVELMMSAGKNFSQEAAEVVKKAAPKAAK